ncbi:MAG: hypothetical protein ACE5DL_01415 [Nitrosopumilaceae archaeon]
MLTLSVIFSFSIGIDFVFAGTDEINQEIEKFSHCVVPSSGNWIVASDCVLTGNAVAPGNVWIQNNSVLTIPNHVTLGVDFQNYNLKVFSGSGVLIKLGGAIIQQETNLESEFSDCSDKWTVTGYYVPQESDYSGSFISIIVEGDTRQFREDFVDSVKVEGWGKTLSGDYLGWYSNSYHLNDNAVDSHGQPLVVGIIAVDTGIVEPNSNLIIPTLPAPWNEIIFLSSDVGGGVQQKHIDVFTGVGVAAEQETFRITGSDNTVCK